MGCIRVDKITEYVCEPLSRCLKDDDPYVRKTAAVCVAKLHDISPELVEDRGFLDTLRDLISDANPTVVANAVSALSEIAENSGKDVMLVTTNVLQKLLAALNECTEWGQVFILDSLSSYEPQDAREAEGIIERVIPRLQHNNSAVVMSAVKVILRYLDQVTNQELVRSVTKKLAPPLVTLLNAEPEIQYVALRNINLIVLKQPRILENEIKVFFCKYNDPIYVKMEKLEIVIRLASDRNIEQVLLEFKEYATEVDVEFVRRAVRAIGRCAIKLDRATERCINVLLDLIQTKVSYVVQEAVVVIKDIFRKYPNKYESIIATLCENLEDLDEPEAKSSMVWIIGEYADRIDNADELLESFLETFQEETAMVQLQLLTATVKLFLKQPDNTQEMVQRVLNLATEHSDNPDLRDRGYVYWRLLSSDPEAARAVVLCQKPAIGDDTNALEPSLLDDLISQIGSLASIYHKPVESFVMKAIPSAGPEEEEEEADEAPTEGEEDSSSGAVAPVSYGSQQQQAGSSNLLDLLDDPEPVVVAPGRYNTGAATAAAAAVSSIAKPSLVNAQVGHGISIAGLIVKKSGQIMLEMDVSNISSTPVQSLAIQLNKNAFGLAPTTPQINLSTSISNGSTASASLALTATPQMYNPQDTSGVIQAAIKNLVSNTVFYFSIPLTMDVVFAAGAGMEVTALVAAWKGFDESTEVSVLLNGRELPTYLATYLPCAVLIDHISLPSSQSVLTPIIISHATLSHMCLHNTDLPSVDLEVIKSKLVAKDVAFVAKRDVPQQEGQQALYFSARTVTNTALFIELKFKAGMNICKVTVRSSNKGYSELCKTAVAKIIT